MIINTARPVDRVTAIVLKEASVLLMYRRNHGKEYYTFPGGGLDAGETVEQALVREMLEETSVKVIPKRLLYQVEWDNRTVQYFFLADYVSGTPMLGDYNERALMREDPEQYYRPEWVKLAELPRLLLYPLEVADKLIEDFRKGFEDGPVTFSVTFATSRQER